MIGFLPTTIWSRRFSCFLAVTVTNKPTLLLKYILRLPYQADRSSSKVLDVFASKRGQTMSILLKNVRRTLATFFRQRPG